MSWMNNRGWMFPLRAAEGEGGGAAEAAPDAGSVLYPDDKPSSDAGADANNAADDANTETTDGEWKEYEPDPNKTDEENAAAKAEHDKTKPVADADKVPEDGKYNLTMPEGIEIDQGLLDALSPEFKEAGLTHAQAQKLTDKYIAAEQAKAQQRGEQWAATISGWVDTAKADPEIGGAKWDGTVKTASGVVNRFGTPELKEYLNASGGGNHPEMIRFMAKVGALIGEDNPAISDNPGGKAKADTATILYPDDQPKGK